MKSENQKWQKCVKMKTVPRWRNKSKIYLMSHWFKSLPTVLITLSRLSWSGFRRIEAPGSALLAIFFDKIKTWIKWRRRLKMSLQKTNFQTKYKLSFSAKGNAKKFSSFELKIWRTQMLNKFDVSLRYVWFLRFN